MSVVTAVPGIQLNNGQTIPQLGFGVFQIKPEDTVEAVSTALQTGYRHVDTAEGYGNEKEVGEAIRKSGLDRADMYVTSKLSNDAHEPDAARRAFAGTLQALGFDYVDLFLIHWPLPTRYGGDFVSTWRTLEEFYRDGRARSIGVSNFTAHHLRRLFRESEVRPAVNQVEIHPFLTQNELRAFCAEHEIAIEAWAPIARGRALLSDPELAEVARGHDRTPAQAVLRWHIQKGHIVFPKSVTPSRIKENFDIFDFELTGEDVERISALDRGERTGPDPDKFDLL
jgi:2,5-diketo-D-gluconate reductase A